MKKSVILGLFDWRNFYALFYGRVKFYCKIEDRRIRPLPPSNSAGQLTEILKLPRL
jgi:hypothetical protein